MNPLDLPGPNFLAFYILMVALTGGAAVAARWFIESADPPRMPEVDPYLIACLRNGEHEAIKVATLSLIDRRLLHAKGEKLIATAGDARVRRPLEKAILEECVIEVEAKSLLTSRGTLAAAGELTTQLENLDLVPSTSRASIRMLVVAASVVPLLILAGIKVSIGMARNRPVSLLLGLAIATPFAIFLVVNSARTTRGHRLMSDLERLFAGLRHRVKELTGGGATNELALLAGVYGFTSLSASSWIDVQTLFPPPSSGGDGGSSCGSSCGGGGGGCGGCGG